MRGSWILSMSADLAVSARTGSSTYCSLAGGAWDGAGVNRGLGRLVGEDRLRRESAVRGPCRAKSAAAGKHAETHGEGEKKATETKKG